MVSWRLEIMGFAPFVNKRENSVMWEKRPVHPDFTSLIYNELEQLGPMCSLSGSPTQAGQLSVRVGRSIVQTQSIFGGTSRYV